MSVIHRNANANALDAQIVKEAVADLLQRGLYRCPFRFARRGDVYFHDAIRHQMHGNQRHHRIALPHRNLLSVGFLRFRKVFFKRLIAAGIGEERRAFLNPVPRGSHCGQKFPTTLRS